VVLVRKRTIPTERPQPADEVSANLADRGYRVVSATDPHGHNLSFLDSEPLLFHSSSSSIYQRNAVINFKNTLFLNRFVVRELLCTKETMVID
jgi:hypothetical protein